MKPDLGFTTFLEHIGLTHTEFKTLNVLDRGQLSSMYLRAIVQPSSVPTLSYSSSSPSSPAIPPMNHLTNSFNSASSDLTHDEIYEHLRNSREYQDISLHGYHFERNKATYPIREINLPDSDLEKLKAEYITWLTRVYAHVPEDIIWNNPEKPMTIFYLMQTVFSLENLKRFDDMLHKIDAEGTGLAAQTIYRGYTYLISCIQTLTGKKGSLVGREISDLSFQAIDRLTDFRNKWTKANTISINHSESKRITRVSEETMTSEKMLKQMYFLLCAERYWLLGEYGKTRSSNIPVLNLRYAVGFCFFATILARPVSRKEVYTTLFKVAMISDHKLVPESPFSLDFAEHKTADSYGVLHCLYPAWFATILHLYMTKLRPALIRNGIWGKGSQQNVFPQHVVSMMDTFLQVSCSGQLNPSVIRNKICQAFDEIKEDSKFFPVRDLLQFTAAHNTDKSKVIVRHYTLNFKGDQERRLQAYIDETFYQPALSAIKLILSYPRIKKRKKTVVSEKQDENSDQKEESREELDDAAAVEWTDFKETQVVRDPFGEAKLIEEADGGQNVRFEPPMRASDTIAKPQPISLHIEDSETVQSHDNIEAKNQTQISREDDEQATAEMNENSESHDRFPDDTSEAARISEEKLPVEIESVMKTLLQAAFRNNYLIRRETIESVIRETCKKVYPLSPY